MTDSRQIIARNIRRRMTTRGMNRQQLANAAGLAWPIADKYYHGTWGPRGPDWQVLERIARALGCTVADLTA